MKIDDESQEIISNVGGISNINSLTHCVTRLRFTLKDRTKVNENKIKELDDVIDIRDAAGQFQVIIGPKVDKFYNIITSNNKTLLSNNKEKSKESIKKKSLFTRLIETLSSILIPSLPPIIGGGMIKGFLYMFWQFGWLSMNSPWFIFINIISDCMFYFFPFLLSVSAAKQFKTNEYMSLALAGAMMYPNIIQGAAKNGSLHLFGNISVPFIDYSASVIPIILIVYIMSFVYRFFENKIPDLLSTIFTPMLTLSIIVPIELILIAPLGFYIGDYIAKGIQILLNLSPIISGFVIGFTRPLLVLTGTHHAMRAIVQQQISTYGGTTIGAMNYMSVYAQATAALGVYFFTRNKKMKRLSFSSMISGYLGVTEPALYGVITKYKIAMLATMIGGGVGGAITSHFGSAEYAMVMSSVLTIPATFGKGFIGIVIGIPVSILVTLGIIVIGKNSIISQDNQDMPSNNDVITQHTNNYINISAPVKGEVIPLSEVSDKTFASGIIGEGIAIKPSDGKIYSPISGEIISVFPTNHAISIKSIEGVELLIHLGIDTVKLNGQFMYPNVKTGDKVSLGDVLLRFDKNKIEEAGFDDTVILVITNSSKFKMVDIKDNNEKYPISICI